MGIKKNILITSLFVIFFIYSIRVTSINLDITVTWSHELGGIKNDYGKSVIATHDGGFIVLGEIEPDPTTNGRIWLIKINSTGDIEWNKTIGGSGDGDTTGEAIVQLNNGDLVIAGTFRFSSNNSKTIFLLKTTSQGYFIWDSVIEMNDKNTIQDMIVTKDGGFALGGHTYSKDKVNGDSWLVKINSEGQYEWNSSFGADDFDIANSLIQCSDDGYALAGWTRSFNNDEADFYLIKTDENGSLEWNRTYGGSKHDAASSVIQDSDGGFLIAGGKYSDAHGESDMWLVKTDVNGKMEWEESYTQTLSSYDNSNQVIKTVDGGFVLVGYTNAGAWLIKTNAEGERIWDKLYGTRDNYFAESVVESSTGDFVIAGSCHPDYATKKHDIFVYELRDILPLTSIQPSSSSSIQTTKSNSTSVLSTTTQSTNESSTNETTTYDTSINYSNLITSGWKIPTMLISVIFYYKLKKKQNK